MNVRPPIEEVEKEIVEEFSLFDSWDDKYEYILDLGKKKKKKKKKKKSYGYFGRISIEQDENKVKGDASQPLGWWQDKKDGRIFYNAESDCQDREGFGQQSDTSSFLVGTEARLISLLPPTGFYP
jgi:cysteine desulfuration protein SufE